MAVVGKPLPFLFGIAHGETMDLLRPPGKKGHQKTR